MRGGILSAVDPFIYSEAKDIIGGQMRKSANDKTISSPRLVAGDRTAVLILTGQSNATNRMPATYYTPTNISKVDLFNQFDGGTYVGTDPLPGCGDWPNSGHWFGRVADGLINDGVFDRVIMVPMAVGATAIAYHAPGGVLYPNMAMVHRRLSAVGLTPTAILWMQGESDTLLGTSQASYSASLSAMIQGLRDNGYGTPWLLSKCTRREIGTSAAVRASIDAAINNVDVFAGPDLDTLSGSTYRDADNTHLTPAGGIAAADMWKSAISSFSAINASPPR